MRIELTPEQLQVYAAADNDFIDICAADGTVVGRVLSARMHEKVAEIRRLSQNLSSSPATEGGKVMFRTLDKRCDLEGPFDPIRMQAIVDEVRQHRANKGRSQ